MCANEISGALNFRLRRISGDKDTALSDFWSSMTSVFVIRVLISSLSLLLCPAIVDKRSFSDSEGLSRLFLVGGEGDKSPTMFPLELKTCLRARLILAGEREERDDSGTYRDGGTSSGSSCWDN